MHARLRRRAFTLIELIIGVSLIVLLIGMTLPSLMKARIARDIATDLADLKQHGAAMDLYAADNLDTLLNHPLSPGFADPADEAYYGVRGTIAHAYATDKLPVNGWDFPSAGDVTPGIPFQPLTIYSDTGLANEQIHAAYVILLGQYVSESRSVPSLEETFLSARQYLRRDTWNNWKHSFRTGEPAANGINYAPDGAGTLPPTKNGPAGNVIGFGSYRYVFSGYTTYAAWAFYSSGTPYQEHLWYFDSDAYVSQPPDRFGSNRSVVVRNPRAQVSYPSSKVLFYSYLGFYDPGEYEDNQYYMDGITSTIALADGSARAIVASREAIPMQSDVSGGGGVSNSVDWAGPFFIVNYNGGSYPQYFTSTIGGIKGRDL